MRQLFATLLAGAVLIVPVVSRAQSTTDYPNRSIRLVVGFAPGGATDTLARLLTGALGQELGQAIYVETLGRRGMPGTIQTQHLSFQRVQKTPSFLSVRRQRETGRSAGHFPTLVWRLP